MTDSYGDLDVIWVRTTHAVYRAIYDNHRDEFGVHSCYTSEAEEGSLDCRDQMTAWGFSGADAPIIKSVCHGGEWTYFIASVKSGKD